MSKLWLFACMFIVLFIFNVSCSEEKEKFQLKEQPEIQQVRQKKPVKIKLHRTKKGEYSWNLTGDDVDEIVDTDKRLREKLEQ